ncbi:MAG: flagellar export chaperone FlgN [Proteobacteria bacterium]|nr:flagellar export chaperone FlgN [Pseudomonadota bacterium]
MDSHQIVFEITHKELIILKDFLKVLREERDAIISFSLEGIIRENNRKEELLKKIEYLENEKEKMLKEITDQDSIFNSERWTSLSSDIRQTMKEINVALGKNMKLLSFSMDHVRSSIENVVGFINKATYGRKQQIISFFPSREI